MLCDFRAGPFDTGYRPRSPENTALYQVVAEHLETFLERAQVDGRGLPRFVERELRAFLRCGIKSYGFTRIYCDNCRREYPLPFSCQTRGFCPCCCGRFMAAKSLELVDHVLPRGASYRQLVLTLPYPLRYRTAYDPRVQRTVIRGFLETVKAWYLRRGRDAGVREPHWGAVTVVQRVASSLRLMPHPHTLALDGVFSIDGRGLYARFRPLPEPSEEEVGLLCQAIARRVLRSLLRRGALSRPGEEDALPDPLHLSEPSQAACYAGSVQGRIAFGPGAGSPIARTGGGLRRLSERPRRPLTAEVDGFNLNAATTVDRGDRQALYRLVKYITRPPLAHDRLSWTEDGRIALALKTPSGGGASHVRFTPDAFLQHLCGMVPRPRSHRLLYSGILAPAARHRALVVPGGEPRAPASEEASPAAEIEAERPPVAPSTPPGSADPGAQRKQRVRKILWAELMRRSLGPDGPDPILCPQCGCRMRPIATLLRAEVLLAILASLGLPTEPPGIQPSRGPPDDEEVVEVRPGPPGEDDLLEIRWT